MAPMTTRTKTQVETLPAREAKNQFGRLLDTAQREPVTITKKDRPVAVLLSKHDFDAMQRDLQEYRSLKETEYLLASPANRERLLASVKELGTVEATTEELRAYED
jgi:prevent-host-death family protein